MLKGFSRSVMGASHEKSGLVCQDSSDVFVCENYSAVVVADGHGSKKHFRSNKGSEFAVAATLETIKNFYTDPAEFEEHFPKNHKMVLNNIAKQIISNWNTLVNEHVKANPVTAEEKSKFTDEEFEKIPPESYYGTTLIAAVVGNGVSFGLQIGDGSFVAIFEDGYAITPLEYNESAPANITASMCNASAASMFNTFYIDDKRPIAFFVSTDGLYTSFGSEYDFLDYHTIITTQLALNNAYDESVIKNLVKRSHFGTEDDISLSCVYDPEFAKENVELLKQRIEENKEKAQSRKKKLLKRM